MSPMEHSDIHLAGTTLRQRRHLCAFFHSREERYRVLGPFVKEGIDLGEKAFHIVDPARREEHLHRLQAAGIDVRAAGATGQLEVRGWNETYLRDGRFDQETTLALLGSVLAEAKDRGFPLTRVIGEMEWALREPTYGIEKLIAYEARVNALFPDCPDPLVCTYDRSQFGAAVAMDVFGVHHLGITGGIVQDNPLLGGPIAFRHPREPADLTTLRKRFLMALLAGARADALDIVVEEGLWLAVPVTDLYLEIVQPALHEMGRLWECSRVSVAHVLLAAEISKLALAQLRAHLPCEPSNGRRVIVACVEGERHDIGAYMVADFLEVAGFDVRLLGPNVPTGTLLAMLDDQPPGMLALSATTTASLAEVRRVIHAVQAAGKGVPIAVGGQLFSARPTLRTELGVDIYACNPRHLIAATRELLDGSRHQGLG
jgi:MerR family transcriptional regulator, light-induced transcriptional regulator